MRIGSAVLNINGIIGIRHHSLHIIVLKLHHSELYVMLCALKMSNADTNFG